MAGSFLSVLVTRLPLGESVIITRSVCRYCRHALGPLDLVPLLSWLLLRGRCRHCGHDIPLIYPALEAASVIVAVWSALTLSGWLVWAGCGLGWGLLALAVIDRRHFILPDVLTLPLIPIGLAVTYGIDPDRVPDAALGALLGYGAFRSIAGLYRRLRGKEGLGAGDAKLLAVGGAWTSWAYLPDIILWAALTGLLVAVMSLRSRSRYSAPMAFGPHLALAIWVVWLHGLRPEVV